MMLDIGKKLNKFQIQNPAGGKAVLCQMQDANAKLIQDIIPSKARNLQNSSAATLSG